MANFKLLIAKLQKAIRLKHGQVFLLTTEQRFSEKREIVYTEYRIYVNMTTEEYNYLFPNDAKNPEVYKGAYVRHLLKTTIDAREMFLYLKRIWDKLESGEMYEQGRRAEEYRIRGRRSLIRGKGRGGRKGVLQDAPAGEELSGGVSGDELSDGDGKGKGDTGEA